MGRLLMGCGKTVGDSREVGSRPEGMDLGVKSACQILSPNSYFLPLLGVLFCTYVRDTLWLAFISKRLQEHIQQRNFFLSQDV